MNGTVICNVELSSGCFISASPFGGNKKAAPGKCEMHFTLKSIFVENQCFKTVKNDQNLFVTFSENVNGTPTVANFFSETPRCGASSLE